MNHLISQRREEILDVLTKVSCDCTDKIILKVIENIKKNKITDMVKSSENYFNYKDCKVDLLTANILRSYHLSTSYIILNLLESYIIKCQCRFDAKEKIYESLTNFHKLICNFLNCPYEPFSISPENPVTSTLHLLQKRTGISKTDLALQIGGIGTSKKTVEHYIELIKTMHPLIEIIKERRGKEIFYTMPNTLHPVHLTLTMEELGTLMRCLSLGYKHKPNGKNYTIPPSLIEQIGLNVLNQSSDYAKDVIASEFYKRDTDLSPFIDKLNSYEVDTEVTTDIDTLLLNITKTGKNCDIELEGKLLVNKSIKLDNNKQGDHYLIYDAQPSMNKQTAPQTTSPISVHKDKIHNISIHK